MSAEQNKATLRRYYDEILNKGNFAVWQELANDDYVLRSPNGQETKGLEGGKQGYATRKASSADHQFIIEEMVAEGETVVVRGVLKGTHTGESQGIPATNKRYNAAFTGFYYFKNGKIDHSWALHDVLTRYQQLGITPPAQPAAPAGR